jgi:hypothetical protein
LIPKEKRQNVMKDSSIGGRGAFIDLKEAAALAISIHSGLTGNRLENFNGTKTVRHNESK